MDINNIKSTLSWFLEYVLIISTILECNSLLLLGVCTESTVNMQTVFSMVILATSVMLLFLKLSDSEKLKIYRKKFFPIIVVMEVYAIIYYFLGVRPSQNPAVKLDYIEKFLLMLPIYSSLVFLERKEKDLNKDRLIYKYSNVVCIIAFINLIVYYISTFHTNELDSELVYLRWYNGGNLSSLVNCLNVCYLYPGLQAQSFNINFLRDFGPFVEPLMFLIPLGTSLFVELFLRGKDDKWCLWRCLLLNVTIFTVQSTYGLMLLVIAWGLKLISLCSAKEKRIALVPATGAVALGCGYFLFYKMRQHNGDDLLKYLMANKHFTDYVYAIKAFMSKPLLAGGYLNDDLTRTFFSEEAMKDIGFSNSIAVVLGQGGIVLGLICMLPFLIGLLQFFSKTNHKYALFMLGPLYLYTITVFHYRYFLIFIFSLGYSLLEIEKSKEVPFRLSVIQEEQLFDYGDKEQGFFRNIKSIIGRVPSKEPIILMVTSLLVINYGSGIWNLLFKGLYYFQFTSGQSGIRVLYGIISIIATLTWFRLIINESFAKKQKYIGIVYAVMMLIGYALVYNTIYAYVDTAIRICFDDRELVRESLVLLCYMIFIVAAHALFKTACIIFKGDNIKTVVLPIGALCLLVMSVFIGTVSFYKYLKTKVTDVEVPIETLKKIIEVKNGDFYSDDAPVLYDLMLNDVTYGALRGEGYRVMEDATILEPKDKELPALFDAGFQVAEISDDKIIYSNDESVITDLSKDGYKFYRYYAFGHEYNLNNAAQLNGLDIIEDEGEKVLMVEGDEKSLIYGPYEILNPGTYTVSFSLKINPKEFSAVSDDDVIVSVRTSHMYGQRIDQLLEVTLGEFDEDGCAIIDSSFSVGTVGEGYEYLVFGKDNYRIGISNIEIRKTPKYITQSNYNVHQKPIYEVYYDLDGNPYEISKGYYGVEYAYDDRDLAVMQRYLGSDFKPVLISNGYSEAHRVYNVKKQVTKESYYGIDSEPIELPDGYHSVEMEYDFSGNRISESYYDLEGNPVMANEAYFKYIRIFNEDNRWIRTEYYDTEGNLILQKEGYAIVERDYDEAGNVTEQRYYGLRNEPVLYNERYHKYRDEFNEKKQCIKELYYGTDGEPILQSGGYYGYERSYDGAGNVISNMYLGADEKSVITDWGYACWHRSYNSKKQIIREEYYDTDEKRILLGSGISAVEYERDSKGNAVSEKYFGIEDEAVLNTSNIAEVKREFNDLNQKILEEYFDLDGKRTLNTSGISKREFGYDESGNCNMDCFYSVDNEKILISGYWKVIRTYNENRKNVHEEYFGTDGNPVLISEKYAMVDFGYDENGKLIKKTFRDVDGNVVEEQIVE